MNQQNGYNAWAALGLQSPLDASYGAAASALQGQNTFDLQMRGRLPDGQAALDRRIDLQQAGAMSAQQIAAMQKAQMPRMLNLQLPTPLSRAQRQAQEVREKNPGMQVQRRTRREA